MTQHKFRQIIFPFLCFSLVGTCLYALIYWLLVTKFDLFHPKEIYTTFLFPIIIGLLVGILYFRKRIVVLRYTERWHDFITAICIIMLIVPLMLAPSYITRLGGKLVTVGLPSQVDAGSQQQYYSIKTGVVSKGEGGMFVYRKSADRHGNKTRFTTFFAAPLVDKRDLSVQDSIKDLWIAISFGKTFPNSGLSEEEVNKFIETSIDKFNNYKFKTNYLANLRYDDNRSNYQEAVKNSYYYKENTRNEKILLLHEEEGTYETRTGSRLRWLVILSTAFNLLWAIIILASPLRKRKMKEFIKPKLRQEAKERRQREAKELLHLFVPSRGFWATPVILNLNILIFLIMAITGVDVFEPQTRELIGWGANVGTLVNEGQWWRLITSMFLHAGIFHLLYNMFALYFIGIYLEISIGSKSMFIIYLICGIAGGIASLIFNDYAASVGASGAIFGLYGLTGALMIIGYLDKSFTVIFWVSIVIFVGVNLLVGFAKDNIDMPAHLGGLITGFVIGMLYKLKAKNWK